MRNALHALVLLLVAVTATSSSAELLDGRVFAGKIGPAENPDLDDSLFFDNGYFWSDICTRCGFVPGAYSATETPEGIVFNGVLESDSRGEFPGAPGRIDRGLHQVGASPLVLDQPAEYRLSR